MKPKWNNTKSTNRIIWENRLQRRLQQQDFEKQLLKLIDRLPEGETREALREQHLVKLAKCQSEIAYLQEEIQKLS
ncbi:hypothetical protein H8B09_10635 [Paenibacillus sp. PR3]|uniref:Uncharacterized protein n=1 Tax=Paenibacillus terricola TaxID=2763503 RepID=A0ABR8MTC6_9BACL|nr:hypothetical protein [Paenibacillus terricola]MBD3919209.1 hypothetical protein [Paenibacillus terricola]